MKELKIRLGKREIRDLQYGVDLIVLQQLFSFDKKHSKKIIDRAKKALAKIDRAYVKVNGKSSLAE